MESPDLLLIDNYDSFTYNIFDYLCQLGMKVRVEERAKCGLGDLHSAKGLVFSPGPGNPEKLPDLHELICEAVRHKPVLGICLGHQAIAASFGGTISKARPMHGKISTVYRVGKEHPLLTGIPASFKVVRYHSLLVSNLPGPLMPVLETAEGELMAFCHKSLPVAGLQFHPEAWLTQFGHQLLKNWIDNFVRS
jgi:anthranilate synthase component 2